MDAVPWSALLFALVLSVLTVLFRDALGRLELHNTRVLGVSADDPGMRDGPRTTSSIYLVIGSVGMAISMLLLAIKALV